MSYRLQVTVADDVADELERRAQSAGQPASRVAATLITLALNSDIPQAGRPTTARQRMANRTAPQPPSWIEPFEPAARRQWRAETWAAVLALHNRYPRDFARLEAAWWRNTARIEQLAALDAWRLAIDHDGSDPREELAFHHQLADLRHLLEHTPGIGADTFQPGPPPHQWLNPTG